MANYSSPKAEPIKFGRTTSCVSNPQTSALDALKESNNQLLSDLLTETAPYGSPDLTVDINKAYPEEKSKTLLHLAVEKENLTAVKILLSSKADPNLSNRLTQQTPIHVAARKGNEDILKVLLLHRANTNAAAADGKTVLHILAKKCNEEFMNEGYMRCLTLVLHERRGFPKVEIDKPDNQGAQTALLVAAKSGPTRDGALRYFEVIRLLLDHGADWSLPCQDGEHGTIRDIIKANVSPGRFHMLTEIVDSSGLSGDNIGSAVWKDLLNLINEAELEDNWDNFNEALKLAQDSDLVVNNPGELSLIQRSAEVGLARHVDSLLKRNIDPNFAATGTAPALILAAKNGHFDVIHVLKEHKVCNEKNKGAKCTNFGIIDIRTRSSVLHSILRKPYGEDLLLHSEGDSMESKYTQCLQVILEDADEKYASSSSFECEIRKVINSFDEMGNTPLHYATQSWPQTIVRLLLEKGANIGMKNAYNEIPVENILPETMESFLDEFCLTSEGDVTNKDYRMTARYDFLAPPRESLEIVVNETNSRMRREGWSRNGLVDTEASLVQDKLRKPKGDEDNEDIDEEDDKIPLPETEVLWYMSQSKQHRHLLKHPVITSFLWMKWKRISFAYNQNLVFYFSFVTLLTSYIFTLYGGKSMRARSVLSEECPVGSFGKNSNFEAESEQTTSSALPAEITILWYLNSILLLILFLRECLQFGIAPRRYFFSLENWLEVSLIGLIGALLFYGGFGCNVTTKRHIAAIVIVLSWSELITMIGRHPKLSTYNIYVTMFYRVISTFIKFLLWYSLFIVAFALGFYILLHRDDGHEPEEDEYTFFNFIGLCLVKTFTMFVGELEFSDLPIDTPVGYLFFLAFIFLIVVVMMNLLNGLAVSDTGVIRQEAEINSYICQVEVISYIESMLLGDPFNFLSNWPSFVWLRRIPSCSLGNTLYRVPSLRKIFHKLTGAGGILLFYEHLPDKKVEFYPNHEVPFCGCLGREENDAHGYDFHPSIMEAAKAVALGKIRAKDSIEQRLSNIEDMLYRLLNNNNSAGTARNLIL